MKSLRKVVFYAVIFILLIVSIFIFLKYQENMSYSARENVMSICRDIKLMENMTEVKTAINKFDDQSNRRKKVAILPEKIILIQQGFFPNPRYVCEINYKSDSILGVEFFVYDSANGGVQNELFDK